MACILIQASAGSETRTARRAMLRSRKRRQASAKPVQTSTAAARGSERGDDLSEQAARFAGVHEAAPGPELAAEIETGKWFPAHDFAGRRIERELRTQVGPAPMAARDGKGQRRGGRSLEAHADGFPIRNPLLRDGPKPIDVRRDGTACRASRPGRWPAARAGGGSLPVTR